MSLCQSFRTEKQLLTAYNPSLQTVYCDDKVRCFTGKAPSLGLIKQAFGAATAETWVAIQLRDLSEFAGCKEKLTTSQISDISRVVSSEFGYMKVTELMYFFTQFKAGKYGHFFGSVDGLVITTALQEFKTERVEYLRQIESKQHKADKAKEDTELAKSVMTYTEYQELKWLFNIGYER